MNESFDRKQDSVYSKRLKAGKRRTYFFDVRSTRGNDYFLTITESRKRMSDDGYDRHKIFLYKEDFHKFMRGLNEAVDFVKTELMPDFNFDAFNHDTAEDNELTGEAPAPEKPEIDTNLLNTSAFEGMKEMDGHALNKIESLPNVQVEGVKEEKKEEPTQDSATGSKPSSNHTEEVDRW